MKNNCNLSNTKAASLRNAGGVGLIVALSFCHNSFAQVSGPIAPPVPSSEKSRPSGEQSKLVDGLLELLEEPDKNNAEVKRPSSIQPDLNRIDPKASQAGANPLVVIRQRMQIAADYLQQGRSDKQTVELQSSIVGQLDELINQLQQQKSSPESNNQRLQQMQQQRATQKQQVESSNPNKSSSSESSSEDNGSSTSGDGPGERLNPADPKLQRNDPAALQQSVWGHLPERVRSQMQSRMVEEFLPSYRQQIEAYYRALLEEGDKK